VKAVLAALLNFLAVPLLAAYASSDAVIPVAGRATGPDGRLFLTALWITNPSERDGAEVTLLFHPGNEKLAPHTSSLRLNPGETRVIDPVDATILGVAEALGALRVTSTQDVLATARLYSRMPNESGAHTLATSFNATPVQFAIGDGESATLQGVAPADGRYKIYFAEVGGMPLDVVVSLLDARGVTLASKRMYVDKNRPVTADVAELFPKFTSGTAALRVDAVNGGGRVVVAGAQIARESQDSTPFEMSFTTTPRDRLGVWEALTYVAVAVAAGAAIFLRNGAPASGRPGGGRRDAAGPAGADAGATS
jgi:hypothetical protein